MNIITDNLLPDAVEILMHGENTVKMKREFRRLLDPNNKDYMMRLLEEGF